MSKEEPSIEYPEEIKNNNYIFITVGGKDITIPCNDTKKIKCLFQKEGKWYVEYDE